MGKNPAYLDAGAHQKKRCLFRLRHMWLLPGQGCVCGIHNVFPSLLRPSLKDEVWALNPFQYDILSQFQYRCHGPIGNKCVIRWADTGNRACQLPKLVRNIDLDDRPHASR
jgi:hypothetical protein